MISFIVSGLISCLNTKKSKIKLKFQKDEHFLELVKGSGVAFILRILGIISGYVFTLLVTRTLGAEAWGIFSLCLVLLQISSVVGRLGMDTVLLRFTAEYTAKGEIGPLHNIYKKVLNLVVPFSILVAFSVYFLSPILADKIFHKPCLVDYFRLVAFIVVPFVLLWIHSESIKGLKKIKEYMLLQQTSIFFIAVNLFLVGLLFGKKSYFLPLVSYSAAIFFLAVISIYLWMKYIAVLTTKYLDNLKSLQVFRSIGYSTILSISIPMLLANSLALVMGWIDIIMLGVFVSEKEVGIYSVVLRIVMIINFVLLAVDAVASPNYAGYYSTLNLHNFQKIVIESAKLTFVFSLPLFFIFLFFPKLILAIFGKEFVVGYPALIMLAIGRLVRFLCGPTSSILVMTGNQNIYSCLIVISMIINIILNYLFIPKFSIFGAAIATTISISCLSVLSYIFVRNKLKINPSFW